MQELPPKPDDGSEPRFPDSTGSRPSDSGSALPETWELRRPDVFTLHLGARVGPEWSDWLDGAEILGRADGSAMVTAYVPDQARLFGLLLRVRDLGIPLLGLYPASACPRRGR